MPRDLLCEWGRTLGNLLGIQKKFTVSSAGQCTWALGAIVHVRSFMQANAMSDEMEIMGCDLADMDFGRSLQLH